MVDWMVGFLVTLAIFALVILFCWLFKDGLGSGSYYQRYYERCKKRRWNKYIQSLDPAKERDWLILSTSSDSEFETFLKQVGPKLI